MGKPTLIDFAAPDGLCPLIDGIVFSNVVKNIVQLKVGGVRTHSDDALLRIYGMDPREMAEECWRVIAGRKRHKAAK